MFPCLRGVGGPCGDPGCVMEAQGPRGQQVGVPHMAEGGLCTGGLCRGQRVLSVGQVQGVWARVVMLVCCLRGVVTR